MPSTKRSSVQATENNVNDNEKTLRSLRSLGTFITFGAWVGVLAGLFLIWSMLAYKWGLFAVVGIILCFANAAALFWCDRLLQQKSQLALVVYTYVLLFSWSAVLISRAFSSRPLFGLRDLFGLIVPALILFQMHKLRQKGVLV